MHSQCSPSTPKHAPGLPLPLRAQSLPARFARALRGPPRGCPPRLRGLGKTAPGWPPRSPVDAKPTPALPAPQPRGRGSSCRTHRSREQPRHATLPGLPALRLRGSAPQPAQRRLLREAAAAERDPEPLHHTGVWCRRWTRTLPGTEKNENERSYRSCRQLAESTRALPRRPPARSRSLQEIQRQLWVDVAGFNTHGFTAPESPTVSVRSCHLSQAGTRKENQNFLRLNLLSAAAFQD